MSQTMCAYCGDQPATDNEHVFPKNLYKGLKENSKVQRLTIRSCRTCNNGWADDEAHFRNVLMLAGEPNASRRKLWDTTLRSFMKSDGHRRIRDLVDVLRPVEVDEQSRYKVYPGEDPRVVRIVNKVIRGLSHYHGILSAVPESRVWVADMKFQTPDNFLSEMTYDHREQDIVEYRYAIYNDDRIQSAWLITFYGSITFIGLVSSAEDGLIEEAD